MQTVDLVIADIGWLITVDSGRRIIRDAAIVVNGGKIAAVGKAAEIAKQYAGIMAALKEAAGLTPTNQTGVTS